MSAMRDRIWQFATRNYPKGQRLTKPLLAIRAILYPLDFLYWRITKAWGYQWETDTWIIDGVHYTPAMRKKFKAWVDNRT